MKVRKNYDSTSRQTLPQPDAQTALLARQKAKQRLDDKRSRADSGGSQPYDKILPLPDAWTAMLARQKAKQRLEDKRTRAAANLQKVEDRVEELRTLAGLPPDPVAASSSTRRFGKIPVVKTPYPRRWNQGLTGVQSPIRTKKVHQSRLWIPNDPPLGPTRRHGPGGSRMRSSRFDETGNLLPNRRTERKRKQDSGEPSTQKPGI